MKIKFQINFQIFCKIWTKLWNLQIKLQTKHFLKLFLICYHIVLGNCDKKYSITSLPIFNIEGGIEAETWVRWILVINTITQIWKKYYVLENKVEKMFQCKFLLYFWFSIRHHCENPTILLCNVNQKRTFSRTLLAYYIDMFTCSEVE